MVVVYRLAHETGQDCAHEDLTRWMTWARELQPDHAQVVNWNTGREVRLEHKQEQQDESSGCWR